jgi:hypothetical protein
MIEKYWNKEVSEIKIITNNCRGAAATRDDSFQQ